MSAPVCAVCGKATSNPVRPPYSGWYTGKRLCGGVVGAVCANAPLALRPTWEVFDPTDGAPVVEGLTEEAASDLADAFGLDSARAGEGWPS